MKNAARVLVGIGGTLSLSSCATVDAIQQLPASWWVGWATLLNAVVEDLWNLGRLVL